jgi:hypothetical protein
MNKLKKSELLKLVKEKDEIIEYLESKLKESDENYKKIAEENANYQKNFILPEHSENELLKELLIIKKLVNRLLR